MPSRSGEKEQLDTGIGVLERGGEAGRCLLFRTEVRATRAISLLAVCKQT